MVAIQRGIQIFTGHEASTLQGVMLPVVVVGTATNAAIPKNKAARIVSAVDAEAKLGAAETADTLHVTVDVLLRYGLTNIYVVVATDGSSIDAAIPVVKEVFSIFNEIPAFILMPGQLLDASVLAGIEAATSMGSMVIVDGTDGATVDDIVALRGSTTSIGQDNERLIITYPWLENLEDSTVHEPLSAHLAATVAKNGSYGQTVSSLPIVGAKPDLAMHLSLTDPESDNAKLNNAGVVTIYPSDTVADGYETWGDRNTIYPNENGIRSFIASIRAEDMVKIRAAQRARKFIDLPSNGATALAATASYNAMFADMAATNNISSGSATWDEMNSDVENGKLKHLLAFSPNNSVQLMQIAIAIGA